MSSPVSTEMGDHSWIQHMNIISACNQPG